MVIKFANARRHDWFAASAFLLSFFIMVWPIEADMLFPLLRDGRFIVSSLLMAVFIPFFISWRRQRREPETWTGRGYLIATTVILVLNVLFVATLLVNRLQLG